MITDSNWNSGELILCTWMIARALNSQKNRNTLDGYFHGGWKIATKFRWKTWRKRRHNWPQVKWRMILKFVLKIQRVLCRILWFRIQSIQRRAYWLAELDFQRVISRHMHSDFQNASRTRECVTLCCRLWTHEFQIQSAYTSCKNAMQTLHLNDFRARKVSCAGRYSKLRGSDNRRHPDAENLMALTYCYEMKNAPAAISTNRLEPASDIKICSTIFKYNLKWISVIVIV